MKVYRPEIPWGRGDPFRRLQIGAAMLTVVVVVGTIGYLILGLTFIDSLYQTIVTITTVGFREIGDVDTGYQIFTIILILTGVGTALFTIGVFLEVLVEGRLNDEFRRRRMERTIDDLNGHAIVCGWGQVGREISATLIARGRAVVIIDKGAVDDVGDGSVFAVEGDATLDATLSKAGVERAATVVVALDQDADNLYVTLSARALNPSLFIVARATGQDAEPKLYQAGADRVVNPHQIGGARMAALVLQPSVADFLDVVMHDRELTIRIEEFELSPSSQIGGSTLRDAHIRRESGATVLAVRRADGGLVTNPWLDEELSPGSVLVALGTDEQLEQLRRMT